MLSDGLGGGAWLPIMQLRKHCPQYSQALLSCPHQDLFCPKTNSSKQRAAAALDLSAPRIATARTIQPFTNTTAALPSHSLAENHQ